ncbi:hypothetical protein F5Y03DRAFT_389051 [Xylaria venustula]|nr:hypothetical protein F5Y03DRAFT_389051 [Xylaria venustula]
MFVIIAQYSEGTPRKWHRVSGSCAIGFFRDQFLTSWGTHIPSPGQLRPGNKSNTVLFVHASLAIFAIIFLASRAPLLPSQGVYLGSGNNRVIRLKRFTVIYPYIRLKNERRLQMRVGLVGLCILANNGVKALQPQRMKILIDYFTSSAKEIPWPGIVNFMILRLLSSVAGIPFVQKLLWHRSLFAYYVSFRRLP